MKLVEGLKPVAKTHDVTPAQVAIAWVLAQGPDIIPIPRTRSAQRMEENNRAALLQLSDEEVQGIRELIQENEVLVTDILRRESIFCIHLFGLGN